ncbi:hypothetical protein [Micropruina sp.]|uniref:hypothetical protein n=1 Tax=Micropruina sp. TaxID=2737536 RepID=UPI0039E4E665
MHEREARMALCCVVEPASTAVTAAVAEHGPIAVLEGLRSRASRSRWAQRAQALDLDAVRRATRRNRLRFVIPATTNGRLR